MSALWERQDYDTNNSYPAFIIYLKQQPGKRSLRLVSDELGHASKSVVEKWSAEHQWQERVAAYDDHIQRSAIEIRAVTLKEAQEALMRDWGLFATGAKALGVRMLQKLLEDFNTSGAMDTKEFSRLVNAMVTLDTANRRNLGLPTQFKTESVDEPDTEGEVFVIGE